MRQVLQHKDDTNLTVKEEALLMQFLIENLKHKSRDNIKSLLKNKQVWVNGQYVTPYNHQLHQGDSVVIKWSPSSYGSLSRSLRIVYQDDHLIVIDKFHGLLSIATEGEKQATAYSILSSFVKQQNSAGKIFVVHRLDRDTSGLMMFAKSEEVQTLLQTNWKDSIIDRTYMAVVEGQVEEPEGTIKSYMYESKALMMHTTKNPEKGDLAITHYRTVKSKPSYSLLEIKLETGRKNQIRLHMQEIGHSIVGDKKYGATGNPIARLALHASVLAFIHPVTHEKMRFESPLPTKFRRLI
ncbi:MAG: RluA family pseudouridine synthase [Bacteroidales bacterium]|nr:RluA family pseudouridine synthase [Bacteroidales bacterium]